MKTGCEATDSETACALLISDVMVAVESACRAQPGVRLILPDELFRWKVNISGGSKIGVIPDAVFGLESEGNASWFFLEADRGTMPIQRGNLRQSSFYRKLLAYEATWAQNIHRTDLKIHRFRVLTVTTSPARLISLRKVCRALKRGHGLFLFSDARSLREEPDLFAVRWQNCIESESVKLLK
jgi:Replication-relaxation